MPTGPVQAPGYQTCRVLQVAESGHRRAVFVLYRQPAALGPAAQHCVEPDLPQPPSTANLCNEAMSMCKVGFADRAPSGPLTWCTEVNKAPDMQHKLVKGVWVDDEETTPSLIGYDSVGSNYNDEVASDDFLSDVSTDDESVQICGCMEFCLKDTDGWREEDVLQNGQTMCKKQDTGAGVADWLMCDDDTLTSTDEVAGSSDSEVHTADEDLALPIPPRVICRPCECCKRSPSKDTETSFRSDDTSATDAIDV